MITFVAALVGGIAGGPNSLMSGAPGRSQAIAALLSRLERPRLSINKRHLKNAA